MCRISGIVSKDKSDVILKMTEQQHDGGPDQKGFWNDDDIVIGHNRLSIVDLSAGKQPMESTRWVVSYNGELYNHMDIRKHLGPMHWGSHSDTLTLVNCIEHKGIDWTLEHIEGMYSFAAYDKFDKKLYLCVDPYGIKPCYWIKTDKYFAFASSPAALTHLKDKWELDRWALIDYLMLGGTKESLFSGIRRVKGGSYVKYDIKSETVTTGKWYERKERRCTEEELIEAVKSSIQSVRIADVPVYLFLSGGIDSTVSASQCKNMNAVHLKSPEIEYAKEVAKKYGNNLIEVDPQNFSARECLEDYASNSGDCSMAALIPYVVSKEVSKFAKCAISSNGADELFFGYNRMSNEVTRQQYQHIFRTGLQGHSWGDYVDYKSTRELELNTYVQYDLNKTLDFSSMCHGLEVRVPYLNKTVVEMALSIPRSKHVNGYGNKSILKKFLKSEGFSTSFLQRPKLGFSLFHEPEDYQSLKDEGVQMLRVLFNIDPTFTSDRDKRYFEASAASFICWYNVWKSKLS